MRKTVLLLILQIFGLGFIYSQQFGGNTPSLKWLQLNSDTARIIYPVGLDSQAQRIASIVHYLAVKKPFSPGDKIYKINIVLQNQTTISNGYVALGPYRSEFLMTPDPNNFNQGSLPWPDQLAAHEYRHVMQFNNFRNGLSRLFYYLFGDDGLSLALNAAVPDWFFEGDAVYNETFTTDQGRGRLPLFMNAFPSLWRSNKHYSFMKLRNGSLKDYVPGHYNLGYLLVNYGREKYGPDFWNKVTHDASAYKGLFYPFQKAVKQYSGISYQTFYNQAFDYYKKELVNKTARSDDGTRFISRPGANYVTNYFFPYQINADSLLYLKSSYRNIAAFVIRDAAGEHILRTKDISLDEQFSYRNGKIVYAAYHTDPRWAWRDYSVIKILDISTGKQKSLTQKTKYFTPDITSDGKRIAAVENSSQSKTEIHILDAGTGKLLARIKSTEVNLFTDPKFIGDTALVSAARLNDGKMALILIDLGTGRVERLTDPGFSVVGYPCVSGENIFFTAGYQGNDDVFVLRLSDHKIFQITHDPLGNYNVNVLGQKAIVSSFTADGYQLREIPVQPDSWREVKPSLQPAFSGDYGKELRLDRAAVSIDQAGGRTFVSSTYAKTTRLLNFHSWRPYYEDPDFTFSVYGQNVLNTLQTEIYYHYNQDENTSGVGVNATYAALFPYLTLGSEYTFNRSDTSQGKTYSWSQLDTKFGFSIPLNFSGGRSYKLLTVGTNYVFRNQFLKSVSGTETNNVNFSYLQHFFSWEHTIQSARQHIFPRLGYTMSVNDRYAIGNYSGYQFIGRASLYLPGFLPSHTIVLSGAFQQRDTSAALFSNAFANARGYPDYYFSRMWKLSANYHFPLFYPDWGFGHIVYFQRIRANAFYDFSKVYSKDKSTTANLRSVGAEVFMDTRWWNQYPLSFGIRFSHLLDPDFAAGSRSNLIELILPTSILPR